MRNRKFSVGVSGFTGRVVVEIEEENSMVWRLVDFEARYLLFDDRRYQRRSFPSAIRELVGLGNCPTTAAWARANQLLRARRNRLELAGAFVELRDVAIRQRREGRGYILAAGGLPASLEEMSAWLGVGLRKCRQILCDLQQVGLIEKVSLPLKIKNTFRGAM